MTLILHAQPYDITAEGFYFRDAEEYYKNADKLTNSAGDPVEEFEIQFIDGDSLECLIALAMGINQGNFARYFELMDELDESDKIKLIIAGECGYTVESAAEDLDSLEIDIYEEDSYRDLAMNFVDEGLFGEIPEHLASYIDYEAIARDLAVDYGDTRIDGKNYIYRSC